MSNDSAAAAATLEEKREAAGSGGSFDSVTEGKAGDWEGKLPAELEQLGEDKLATMSVEELEREMGLDIPDRTRTAHPTGNLTVAETDRQIESGDLKVPSEEVLAAQMVAALEAKPAAAPAAAAAPADKPAAAAADTAAAAADPEGEPVVTARDGKGVIPYTVLEAARARVAALESENAALKGEQQKKTEEAAIKGALTDEQIAAMREEFPEAMVDAIAALNTKAIELQRENLNLRRGQGGTEEDPAQVVTDIIDQDKVLSGWRDSADQKDWNRAVRFDDMLRQDEVWKDKPVAERFAEVKRLMGVPTDAAPQKTPAQIAQEAAAAAEAAALAARGAKPIAPTHSDLPGGQPPANSEQSRVEALSMTDLEKAFEGNDINAVLAKFG